jgi:hypothetical protein
MIYPFAEAADLADSLIQSFFEWLARIKWHLSAIRFTVKLNWSSAQIAKEGARNLGV